MIIERKILCVIMALLMLLGVFAAAPVTAAATENDGYYDYDDDYTATDDEAGHSATDDEANSATDDEAWEAPDYDQWGTIGDCTWKYYEYMSTMYIEGEGSMGDEPQSIEGLLKDDAYLESVIIEEGVTSICPCAFKDSESVWEVVIPETVETIGKFAFQNAHAIECIEVPEAVTELFARTFEGCVELTDLVLNEGLEKIGDYCFSGCECLDYIELPSSLTSIGAGAFAGLAIEDVEIPEQINTLNAYAFKDCESLFSVYLPYSIKKINKTAFSGCESLSEISYEGINHEWETVSGYNMADFDGVDIIYLDSVDLEDCKMDAISAVTYTGKAFTPAVTIKDRKFKLVEGVDYKVEYRNNILAGKSTVIVKGKGCYTGSIKSFFEINKADNPVKIKNTAKTVKYSALKKASQVITPLKVTGAKGNVTYKKTSGKTFFTVNSKTGKITVKKKSAKGTYSVKVKVTAAGNANYKNITKTVTVSVKIK